eukprot:COSAG03_NODE_16330_length_405_cov_0.673203_1_plen_63_part_01
MSFSGASMDSSSTPNPLRATSGEEQKDDDVESRLAKLEVAAANWEPSVQQLFPHFCESIDEVI